MSRRGVFLGLLAAGACSGADPGVLAAGETGVVIEVRDGDALVLSNGLTVRLAEIEAPRKAWKDRPADAYGVAAAQLLETVAIGRTARLFYGGLTRDRYDRAIAHVRVQDEAGQDIWLNGYMVRQGGARVRSWADNAAMVRSLYALEDEARRAGAGLWALDPYRVLAPNGLRTAGRGLAIVEGRLAELLETSDPYGFSASMPDGGLVISLGLALVRSVERLDISVGNRLRIRGGIRRSDTGEARMSLDHWGQVEILGDDG